MEPAVADFGAVFEGEQVMIDVARRLVEHRKRAVGFDGDFEEFVRGRVGGGAERADGPMEHRGGLDKEGIEAEGGQVDIDGDRVALTALGVFAPAECEVLRPFAEFGLDVKYLVFKRFAINILQQEGVVELRAEGIVEFRRPIVREVDGDDDGSLARLRQRVGDGDGEFVRLLRQIFAEGGEIAERLVAELLGELADLVKTIHHVAMDLVDGATADGIVRMIRKKRLPRDFKHHLRGGLDAFVVGDGEKRFGLQFKEGLRFIVGLLHAGAGGDAVRNEP